MQTSEFHRAHGALIAFAISQAVGEACLAALFAAAALLPDPLFAPSSGC